MNTPLPPLDTDSLRAAAARLPALPAVVVELVTSLDAEDVDADTLAEIISRDQILVARLLRLANSSFYGMLGRIHSIRDAIMLIGLRGVRSLAIAASLSGALPRECTGLSLQHFWRHSTATAIAAQELARRNRLPADLAFIAGLLHDIGRLILANTYPQHSAAVQQRMAEVPCLCYEAERQILGLDHADFGRIITNHWRFPAPLITAIGGHHNADAIGQDMLAACVHLAELLAAVIDPQPEQALLAAPPDEDAWRRLMPPEGEALAMCRTIQDQIAASGEIFSVH
jgi:putative nucleotidyltransferase with HDIG domain